MMCARERQPSYGEREGIHGARSPLCQWHQDGRARGGTTQLSPDGENLCPGLLPQQ